MSRTVRRLTDRAVRGLVLTTEPWLSCEECFELLDVYVDAAVDGSAGDILPALRVHLAGCPACAEEALSLLELVSADRTRGRSDDPPPA